MPASAPALVAPPATARDRRWTAILDHAARLFAEKGYEGASLRDLARTTGISLAGLYHYFDSKEALLHALQKHTLETVLAGARAAAEGRAPRAALEAVIANHLRYFLANRAAMKVLSHEAAVLSGARGEEIARLKHQYYELCLALVAALAPAAANGGAAREARTAVMSLFGMLNWIYTWHRERRDPDAATLAAEMSALFLDGWTPVRAGAAPVPVATKRSNHGNRHATARR